MVPKLKSATTCCFFGHREITETQELRQAVYLILEQLILHKQVDTFLLGSKSRFNRLCYEQVTALKEKYPHIKRIYVRAEFSEISPSYRAYLLERYEDTYYPAEALNTGRATYVQRNRHMIDNSDCCIVTQAALQYAVKKIRISHSRYLFPFYKSHHL